MFFSNKKITVLLGDEAFSIPLADNFLARAFGLMFRDPRKSVGMFFDLGSLTKPIVWNLGMRFPIAIVWLRDGEALGVSRLPRFSLIPRIIVPSSFCDAFLELPDLGLSDEALLRVRISRE